MIAPAPMPHYIVSNGDAQHDRDTVLSIWHGNLGRVDHIAAKYDWCYLHSPFPAPLIKLLKHAASNDWVGSCCVGKRHMCRGDSTYLAGVMADLAVLPDHRSLGPAMMLQQAIVAEARQHLDLLYGFPNLRAVAVFKRSGYTHLTDLVRYVHVLRSAHYLHRHLPTWLVPPLAALADTALSAQQRLRRLRGPALRMDWCAQADSRMDVLWQHAPREGVLLTVRDAHYLRWRFDRSPMASHHYLTLTPSGSQHLCAWFATQLENGTLHVRDYWSDHGVHGLPVAYIDALLHAARQRGAVAVSVQISERKDHLLGWDMREFRERGRRPVYGLIGDRLHTQDPRPALHLSCADEDE